MSLVNNEAAAPGNLDYFFLTPNTTESISRTTNFVVDAASTVQVFLRGKDATNSIAYFRPVITLVYLP